MKYVLLLLTSILLITGCSDDDIVGSNISTSFTVSNQSVFTYAIGYPTSESTIQIQTQAQHYMQSEIIVDQNTGLATYTYQSEEDYTGTEIVKIYTKDLQLGQGETNITLNITVTN